MLHYFALSLIGASSIFLHRIATVWEFHWFTWYLQPPMDGSVPALALGLLNSALTLLVCFLCSYLVFQHRSYTPGQKRVVVFVLGDFGRSPRMQYHTLSLANSVSQNTVVDVVAFEGSTPIDAISQSRAITLHLVQPVSLPRGRGLFVVFGPLKVVFQILQFLYILLFKLPQFDYILVQNPPAIPSLFIAQVVCLLRWSKLVIDWHNYGYTILGLKLGPTHLLTRISYFYEGLFGKFAHRNLCVTQAMQKDLQERWKIPAKVLYDKAPSHFQKLGANGAHRYWSKMASDSGFPHAELDAFMVRSYGANDSSDSSSTWFTRTKVDGNTIGYKKQRPAVVVSSTSWTPDEDFSVLLEAIVSLEAQIQASESKLKVVFIITGKGPQKAHYLAEIAKLQLQSCLVLTAWLAIEDYPVLLGCANLGVSLHTSSSGLDLPMKVVDMFGAGLPVCAIDFPCLHELVQDGKNGLTFDTSAQLSEQLWMLLKGFPKKQPQLKELQLEVRKFQLQRWDDNWIETARSCFL